MIEDGVRAMRRKRVLAGLAIVITLAIAASLVFWLVNRHERVLDFTSAKPIDESLFDNDDLAALKSLVTDTSKSFCEARGADFLTGFSLKGVGIWNTDETGKRRSVQMRNKDGN